MQDNSVGQQEDKRLVSKKLSKRAKTFSKIKRRFLKHILLARLTILAAVFAAVSLIILIISLIFRNTAVGNFFKATNSFIFTPKAKIESFEGRTNILILGKGGAEHEAGDLADTIIFVSFHHKLPSVTLISLSRDIWIPALRAKLNSTYYWGNQRQVGGGIVLAKSTVEEIVGQPVHYAVVVDFSDFTKLIDILGGIEVDVERGFVDEKYPIPGREDDDCDGDPEYKCRYETIQFDAGRQLMDGVAALKFVRSRNAEGDEGTDLARAARQQKALVAIKERILSPGFLLSPKKVLETFKVARQSFETDIELSAGAILARRALQARGKTKSHVLSEDFLVNPPISPRYDNLYVFIPRENDWSEVHEWVKEVLP